MSCVVSNLKDGIFVHDRIYNSVADYRSSRVGVGCRMEYGVCPPFFIFSQWDNCSIMDLSYVSEYYVHRISRRPAQMRQVRAPSIAEQ